MEIAGMPFYDDDIIKMLIRFGTNFTFLFVIVQLIYYKNHKKKDYVFTYYLVSAIVFILCFTLKKYDLELGMALGLFAIFGILRYRTDTVPIKEMTYLFIVIGLSVANSLMSKKMSYSEVLFGNLSVTALAFLLEKFSKGSTKFKLVVYEEIENIKPEREAELKADLANRTGLDIDKVEVQDIDFLKDVCTVKVYYK